MAHCTQLRLTPSSWKSSPSCNTCPTPCTCRPLQAPLDDLLRDFANPRETDRYFPFARHMDWFDGHSWASGYTVFAAGKNQVRQPCALTFTTNAFAFCWLYEALLLAPHGNPQELMEMLMQDW
jgi:Glycosyl hydrolase family 81 C-terminal domain